MRGVLLDFLSFLLLPWLFFLLFWWHLAVPFAGTCFQLTLGVPFSWHPVPCPFVGN